MIYTENMFSTSNFADRPLCSQSHSLSNTAASQVSPVLFPPPLSPLRSVQSLPLHHRHPAVSVVGCNDTEHRVKYTNSNED